MGQNDNTLGAPTEGLGQKVTFAFASPRGESTMDSGGSSRLQANIQGGDQRDTTFGQGVRVPGPDPTMAILMRAGANIIAPKIEQMKTEKFVEGMQRAMQGEAIQDIARNQPWYSKVFGGADVIEGARAYYGNTRAQEAVAAMEDQMPQLRSMEPPAARKFFTDSVTKNLTGDKPADAAILQSMTRALPAVMRRQAKEHYGWKQEQASAAESASFKAGANNLQSAAKGLTGGYTTPEEFKAQADSLVASVVPALGRDLENYQKARTADLVGAARNGQFHVVNALKDRGFMDVLTQEQRNTVDGAVEAGESKLRTRYSFDWNDDLAKVEAQAVKPQTGQTTQQIADQVDALNKRYADETGSRAGLIGPTQRAAMLSGSAVAIAREKDRIADLRATQANKLRDLGDKAAADASMDAIIQERAADGSLGTLSANPKIGKERINTVAYPMYQQMKPEDQVKFLVNNMRENYIIEPVKLAREGAVTSVLSAEQYTPAVDQVFKDYVQLRETNRFVADAYYGKHAHALEGFYNDLKGGATVEGAFRDRFVGPGARTKLSKDEMKTAVEVVSKDYNSFLPEWMGGQKLQPGTAHRVANELTDSIERFSAATGNVKEATARALKQSQANGLELMGGYTWKNSKGQQPLSQYLTTQVGPNGEAPRATDKLNEEFGYAVEELLYGKDGSHGIAPDKASDTYVGRLPDKGNVPMFHIQAVVDGKPYDGVLAASDIYKLADKRRKLKAAEKQTFEETAGRGFTMPAGARVQDTFRPNIVGKPTR